MEMEEQKVWNVIQQHVGQGHAIGKEILAKSVCMSERVVRDIVRTLRINHQKLICYSQSKPGGYFVAASLEELKHCRNQELSREIKIRENRQFYDKALTAIDETAQGLLFATEVAQHG